MKVEIINYETKILTLENFGDDSVIVSALAGGVNRKLELLSFNIRRSNKERIDTLTSETRTVIKVIRDLGYETTANDMHRNFEECIANGGGENE